MGKGYLIMKWHGITHPFGKVPEIFYIFWKLFFCTKGCHLLDEVSSWDNGPTHYLVCDACQFRVDLKD